MLRSLAMVCTLLPLSPRLPVLARLEVPLIAWFAWASDVPEAGDDAVPVPDPEPVPVPDPEPDPEPVDPEPVDPEPELEPAPELSAAAPWAPAREVDLREERPVVEIFRLSPL